jgi:flavin-dependent dehydrogenase
MNNDSHVPGEMKIAIIGGGPAGSFSCHFLNKFAKETGKQITIDIYDFKCFSCGGKVSCNMCAGIISATLTAKLEKENIHLPDSVIKNKITGYQLHSGYNTVYFKKEESREIYSVFRGQGPMHLDGNINSFDQFLQEFVSREANVSIINKRVTGLDFSRAHTVGLKTEDESTADYDFVIGAFGVNTKIKDLLNNGYRPPKTVKFLQFETNYPEEFIRDTYKNRVHMFPVYRKSIWYITLTPKWNFVTVTAVGKNVKLKDLKAEILSNKNIRHYLPGKKLNMQCACVPELPVGFAQKPYGPRFLVVGDACVSRYLKNGIESAYQTAFLAADSIINHGTSEKILKKYYFRRCKNLYRFDNLCGQLLYKMEKLLYLFPLYTEAHIISAKKEQVTGSNSRFSDVLWDMFTGDKSYKTVLKHAVHPYLIYTVLKELLRLMTVRVFKGKSALHYPVSRFNKLLNSSTVAIIGGGPAGSCCAIKLAQLSKEKKLNLNIHLFEGKDFTRHHNQCVGILSPPLMDIFEKELDFSLPEHLIRSEVPGYELHTEKEEIFLKNYHTFSPSVRTYSVRRSELDHFLLDKAREHGVKVVNSRVTNIEFCKDIYHDEVRIFSESNYLKADVAVCAFGLDPEMLFTLNQATDGRYRRPKKIMKTFVTRFDFPKEMVDKTYDKRIYPFLIASLKHVRFGAITVKDGHIVVNVAGEKIESTNLKEFLAFEKVTTILPENIGAHLNYFSGKFPSSPARKPYGHRYVAVGDTTGWLRPLKGKGINLAAITGINAAKVMMEHGYSKKDFEYYKKSCKEFLQDYKYGILVRMSLKILIKTGILDFMIRKAKHNSRLHNLLYDTVSAESSYKHILQRFLHLRPPPVIFAEKTQKLQKNS